MKPVIYGCSTQLKRLFIRFVNLSDKIGELDSNSKIYNYSINEIEKLSKQIKGEILECLHGIYYFNYKNIHYFFDVTNMSFIGNNVKYIN